MVNTKIIEHILHNQKWKSFTHSAKTRPRADSGSDHAHYCKIQAYTEERPFGYDLNQIPYEVTNRFKGLKLVDRVPEELWTEVHNTVQEVVTKPPPPKKNKKKEMQEGKMVV